MGCGPYPTGDVNLDLYQKPRYRPDMKFNAGFESRPEPNNPNIVADCMHLPFRDKSIEEVYSSHTIEHIRDPVTMVREMERVAINQVVILCPAQFSHGHRANPFHLWTFKPSWFNKLGYSTEVSWGTLWDPLFRFFKLPITIGRMKEIRAVKAMKPQTSSAREANHLKKE